MTDERFGQIINVIGKPEEAEFLCTNGPEEAVARYAAQGYDFTVDEVSEAVCTLDKLSEKKDVGELGEGDLESVSGGGILLGIAIGAAIGTYAYFKKKGFYVPDPVRPGKLVKIGGKKKK